MSDTIVLSKHAQAILDSMQGDVDEAIVHLYHELQKAYDNKEREQITRRYNELAAYANQQKGQTVYRIIN